MKNLPILTISLLTMLALGACKKEKPCKDPSNPKCENYDPCYGKKAPSADFIIEGNAWHALIFNGKDKFSIEDSIFYPNGNGIRFIAKEEDAKYTWKLGSETIEQKEFYRTFGSTPFGTFWVSLNIEKDVNNRCFPDYTGTATLTKKFETRPYYAFPIMGKYKVLFEGSTDSSIVEIRPYKTSTVWLRWEVLDSMSSDHVAFIGLRNGTDTFDYYRNIELGSIGRVMTGSNIVFNDNSGHITNGYIKLVDGIILDAQYTASFYAHNPKKRYKFKGRKIE